VAYVKDSAAKIGILLGIFSPPPGGPSAKFLSDQGILPAGLPGDGGVFFGPSYQVRDHFLNRAVRKVFGYVKSGIGQIKTYIITHSI
jgi:hypothetical protein